MTLLFHFFYQDAVTLQTFMKEKKRELQKMEVLQVRVTIVLLCFLTISAPDIYPDVLHYPHREEGFATVVLSCCSCFCCCGLFFLKSATPESRGAGYMTCGWTGVCRRFSESYPLLVTDGCRYTQFYD